jgi:hypothetical protein
MFFAFFFYTPGISDFLSDHFPRVNIAEIQKKSKLSINSDGAEQKELRESFEYKG